MSIEVHPSAFLSPYVCAVCGCSVPEPHVLITHLTTWEGGAMQVCQPCVQEMADTLGLRKTEPPAPVQVPREPTTEEIMAAVERRFTLVAKVPDKGVPVHAGATIRR